MFEYWKEIFMRETNKLFRTWTVLVPQKGVRPPKFAPLRDRHRLALIRHVVPLALEARRRVYAPHRRRDHHDRLRDQYELLYRFISLWEIR